MTWSSANGTKVIAAAIGGGALVAMGVFTAMVGGPPTSDDGPLSAMGPMTQGATVTEVAATTSTPPATLPTEKALPAVKAKAYK
ncbi:hypothetical protein BH09ACT8_BH09ACT8_16880 [soil metagenome]